MELYIGGVAQGKRAYVLQERGIAKEEIWEYSVVDFSFPVV